MTELWLSRARLRGYDHPVDRIVIPNASEKLIYGDHQKELTKGQLPGVANAARNMASIAYKRMTERDELDVKNLGYMGSNPNGDDDFASHYRQLDDPSNMATVVEAFAAHTANLPRYPNAASRNMSNSLNNFERIHGRVESGYAVTLGTKAHLGDWLRPLSEDLQELDPLDRAVKTTQNNLRDAGYEVVEHLHPEPGALLKYTLIPVETPDVLHIDGGMVDGDEDESLEINTVDVLHVIRTRASADIRRRGGEVLHVIKVFESLIAFNKLSNEVQKLLYEEMVSGDGYITSKERTLNYRIVDFFSDFETSISQHKQDKSLPVSPVTTTYVLRNPKND